MTATFAPEIKMHHATRAKAERLVGMLAAEYPGLTLEAVEGDAIDHEVYDSDLDGFRVVIDEDDVVWKGAKVPELADVLDACAEQDIDPTAEEGDEDEEPEASGSVVDPKYREEYRYASSSQQGCGDWLNEWLNAKTLDGDNKKDMVAFDLILRNNGVEPMNTK